jgi:dCMP deaminase
MKLKYILLARKISKQSTHKFQIGAVLVKKNKILSIGYNQADKTHPKSPHPFKTIHAELDCILQISEEDVINTSIYIYREHANGELANAKPCIYCHGLLKNLGIKKVYYTDKNSISCLEL